MSDPPDVEPTAANAADALERWLRSDAAGEPPPEVDSASAAVARRLLAAADVAPDSEFVDDLAAELAARHPTVSPPPSTPALGTGPGGLGAGAMLAGIGFLLFTLFGLLIAWQDQQQAGAPAGSAATTEIDADSDRATGTVAPTRDPRARVIGTANVGSRARATPSATGPARDGTAGVTRTAAPLRATATCDDARGSGVGLGPSPAATSGATSATPGSGAKAPTPPRPATERPPERNTPRPAATAGPVPSDTMPPATHTLAVPTVHTPGSGPTAPTANTPGHTPEPTAQPTRTPGEPTREPSRTPREPTRTPGDATATPREPGRTPSPPSGTRERTPAGRTPDATRTPRPGRTPGFASADRPDRAPSRARPPSPLGRRS